ncbi:hypothetical protein [Streptomyces albipurpureus]|uniref:Uncharacterized protein n=1 Tax=Streptomyces albipurpureus TaxID=2897419 RepID=A0ABT0UU14_9ACTN|nr:hypothetical protein [Streptomyces sp. CWNU-1]MCM2392083.1 hypothetical protein [Streptomyces sp. CWNU-1]
MSLKTLQIGREDIRRMVALTAVPWEREPLERKFIEYAWAPVAPTGGKPQVGWGGGAGSPHYFGQDSTDAGCGRRLELGDAPGGPAHTSGFIQLPCALFWPAFGDEPADLDPDDSDDLDGEYNADWIRFPTASRVDFRGEYGRIGALLRAELGAPDASFGGEMDEYREVWYRQGLQLELHRTDDLNSYSHYDVIQLRVTPLPTALDTAGACEPLQG